MKIDNEFTVSVPVEKAWAILTDLEGIAPCLPGAKLTGVDGDVFRGRVKVKVGPVVSEYAGTAQFAEKDDATYRAVIDARGKDPRGAGNASAMIRASLSADGERTIVSVDTDLTITGKIAQFGSGMISEVSTKLLGQFAQNLEAKLQGEDRPQAPATAGAAASSSPPADAPSRRSEESEPAPLDLLSVAGSAVYKRALPLVAALAGVAAVFLLRRRRRNH